jgi:hypothetical protein
MSNLSKLSSGQLSATTAAAVLGASASTEQGVLISTTASIYVGGSGVTASTGLLIAAGQTVLIPVDNVDQIYVVASTTATVSYLVV